MGLVTLVIQIVVMQVWKLSPRFLLRYSFLIFAIVLFALANAGSTVQMYLIYAAMGLAVALATPGLNAAASLAVGPQEQGAVAGLLAAAPAFGMIFGPALGGILYNVTESLPMMLGGSLVAVLGVYFWFVAIPEPTAD